VPDHVRPSPANRGHPGSKHHLIVDARGPTLTGANRHDVTRLLPLLDPVLPIRGMRGRPRRKPRELFADRGYDFDKFRADRRHPRCPFQEVAETQ
jgi:hypothetical protein